MITACLFGLILGGEILLPVFEEIGLLAFEWVEKTLDIFFEAVFDFAPESAQKATAWTGLFLIIGLLIWVGHTLRRKYLQAKAAAPHWWAEKKAELKTWWASLPWTLKLAHIAGYLALVGILAVFI